MVIITMMAHPCPGQLRDVETLPALLKNSMQANKEIRGDRQEQWQIRVPGCLEHPL
jgi:hypothetical protein